VINPDPFYRNYPVTRHPKLMETLAERIEGLSDPGPSDDGGRPSGDRAEVESDRPA
jgi:hypothetical protein